MVDLSGLNPCWGDIRLWEIKCCRIFSSIIFTIYQTNVIFSIENSGECLMVRSNKLSKP